MSTPSQFVAEQKVIGIVIKPDNEMIFSNGLHQNALNLYYTINQIAGYTPVLVACDSHLPPENRNIETPYMMAGDIPVRPLSIFYKTYQLHALLLVSVSPDPKDCHRIKQTGAKIVATSYGHKFAMAMEAMAFGNYYEEVYEGTGTPTKKKASGGFTRYHDNTIDKVWYSPHFIWTKQYLAHLYSLPLRDVSACPYIWSPKPIESVMKDWSDARPDFNPYYYRGDPKNKSFYSTEPNINVLKTTLIPFGIVEEILKSSPGIFDEYYMFGGQRLSKNSHFLQRLKYSVASGGPQTPGCDTPKIQFEHRRHMAYVYSRAKVQLAHHWDCGLNYTLLEAAHYHHPIVHNSEFMKDLGYYYKGANVYDAVVLAERALRHGERDDLLEYNKRCDMVVERFSYNNQANMEGYKSLLDNLFDSRVPVVLPGYIRELEEATTYGDAYLIPQGNVKI